MREIISIHIGQAGVQMSNAIWEQFCSEHSLDASGILKADTDADSSGLDTFFCSSAADRYVPRSVSIDLEPTVIDEIRSGPYRRLFHPNMLISGVEDASSNFARGHFTIGKDYIDNCIKQIRKLVQTCDALHGFIITSSVGGGTGSGFQALMLERLSIEFAKYIKVSILVYPSSALATSTVEPYNCILTNNFTMDISDLCILFDNSSMYKLCKSQLSLDRPSYSNLNKIIAHIISSMTVSLRYESTLNSDLDQIVTNIVPFPRIHFPVLNCAPLLSEDRASHKILDMSEITRMVFDVDNTLVNVNTSEGDFLSCCLQYRGNVTPRDANEAIFEVKKQHSIRFVDWCPTGFKVGLNCHPPLSLSGSGIAESNIGLSMLANTTAIEQVFRDMSTNFQTLFRKRSFIHWFIGEGMEEGEFEESLQSMDFLITDYNGMGKSSEDGFTRSDNINEKLNDIENEEKKKELPVTDNNNKSTKNTENEFVENKISKENFDNKNGLWSDDGTNEPI